MITKEQFEKDFIEMLEILRKINRIIEANVAMHKALYGETEEPEEE